MKTLDMAMNIAQQLKPRAVQSFPCHNARQAGLVARQLRQVLRENGAGGTMTVTVKDNLIYVGEKQTRTQTAMQSLLKKFMLDTDNDELYEQAQKLLEA